MYDIHRNLSDKYMLEYIICVLHIFLLFIISLSWSLPHAHTLTNLNVPSVTSLLAGTKGHVSGDIHLCQFQDRRVSINNWAQGALSNHRTTLYMMFDLGRFGIATESSNSHCHQFSSEYAACQKWQFAKQGSWFMRTKLVMLLCRHSGYFETFI